MKHLAITTLITIGGIASMIMMCNEDFNYINLIGVLCLVNLFFIAKILGKETR